MSASLLCFAFALIAPSTLLMGMSFPVWQKMVQDNRRSWPARWVLRDQYCRFDARSLACGMVLLRGRGSSGILKLWCSSAGFSLSHRVARPATAIDSPGWYRHLDLSRELDHHYDPQNKKTLGNAPWRLPRAIIARGECSDWRSSKATQPDSRRELSGLSNGMDKVVPYGAFIRRSECLPSSCIGARGCRGYRARFGDTVYALCGIRTPGADLHRNRPTRL